MMVVIDIFNSIIVKGFIQAVGVAEPEATAAQRTSVVWWGHYRGTLRLSIGYFKGCPLSNQRLEN
jgi:hypothetical protein